jgi:hypothetical protein
MPVGSRALVIILPTMGHASANQGMKLTTDPSMAVTERYRRRAAPLGSVLSIDVTVTVTTVNEDTV